MDDKVIRQVPAVDERVETGAVRFGDDWPGLFIRGDNCAGLQSLIQRDSGMNPHLKKDLMHLLGLPSLRR